VLIGAQLPPPSVLLNMLEYVLTSIMDDVLGLFAGVWIDILSGL